MRRTATECSLHWDTKEVCEQRFKATYGGFIECAIPSFEAYGKIHVYRTAAPRQAVV